MKKILFLLSVVVATLSSCTIEKRHHLSGYHIDWHHNLKKGEPAYANGENLKHEKSVISGKEEIAVAEQMAAQEENVTVEAEVPAVAIEEKASAAGGKKAAAKKSGQNVQKAEAPARHYRSSDRNIRQTTATAGINKVESYSGSRISDLVLVILAIFISPLAV